MLGSSDFDQNVMSLGRGAYFFRREWGEPFFGGMVKIFGGNLWSKSFLGGGGETLSPSLPKKYAGRGTCIVPYIFCWGIIYKSPKLSQESSVLLSESSYFN